MDPSLHAQIAVLDRLLHDREPVAHESLARATGLSAPHIAAAIDQLRSAGSELLDEPHRGVRLVSSGLGCWVDYIEQRHADTLGRRLIAYRTTTSTQEVARTLVAGTPVNNPAGAVVVSDHQTAGRGRLGRRWFDSPGRALAFTAIVDPAGAAPDRLCLAACCATADAVVEATGLAVDIRWPNDLLIDGRKLAGILVETVNRHALIGVGINVGPTGDSLPPDDAGRRITATSLADHGSGVDRLRLLDATLTHLADALADTDESLRKRWRERSGLINERVTVTAAGSRLTGRVIDIDPQQGLVLEVERGPIVALPAATTSLVLD